MHYIRIKTDKQTIEFVVDNYFDKQVQEAINQPCVQEVYLRCVDYENVNNCKNIKKLVRKNER